MSSPYDQRGSSRRRGVWGYWVPLVLTVTVATVGIAAWAWSQRTDEEEETEAGAQQHQHLDYNNADYGDNPPYGARGSVNHPPPPPSFHSDLKPGEAGYGTTSAPAADGSNAAGWGSRMSGALRRTPSPQQFLDTAGKTVAAGVAAAGAAVGSALASIREEDKNAYADHETWSEEADSRKMGSTAGVGSSRDAGKRRKTVAIVVSADTHLDDLDDDGFHEHASILSHIPKHIDFSKTKLFIMIYAPALKETAVDTASNLPPASLSSSFSNISHTQAQSPKDEKSPLLNATTTNPAFNAVYSQALALAEKETMVLPFTSANGHSHILRHLQPDVVYLQESLAGENGSVVAQLQTWLSKDIILVVGAESGHGGLADSESEAEKPGGAAAAKKWWQREERVGRGRGVVVVDGMRVGDDWARRVQGKE